VNGVATFSGVQAVVAGTKYQFNVSSDSIPVIDQSSPGPGFDVVAATAAALTLSSQPQNTASGTSIVGTPHPAVEAQLTDAYGNAIVSDNGTVVTLTIDPTNPAVELFNQANSTPLTATTIQGLAVFDKVGVRLKGSDPVTGVTLKASATVGGPPFTTDASRPFDVPRPPSGQVAPASIELSDVPTSPVDVNQPVSFTVTLKASQNTPLKDIPVRVSLTASPDSSLATRGTVRLNGRPRALTTADGVASFPGMSITNGGTWTIQALSEVG